MPRLGSRRPSGQLLKFAPAMLTQAVSVKLRAPGDIPRRTRPPLSPVLQDLFQRGQLGIGEYDLPDVDAAPEPAPALSLNSWNRSGSACVIHSLCCPSAGGQPPRKRAIPRANVSRPQATRGDAKPLLGQVKCSVSPLQPRPATPG